MSRRVFWDLDRKVVEIWEVSAPRLRRMLMFVSMFSNSPRPMDINWHHSPVPMSAFVSEIVSWDTFSRSTNVSNSFFKFWSASLFDCQLRVSWWRGNLPTPLSRPFSHHWQQAYPSHCLSSLLEFGRLLWKKPSVGQAKMIDLLVRKLDVELGPAVCGRGIGVGLRS